MQGKSDSGCFDALASYFIYEKESGTYWIGGCMEPTVSLIVVEKKKQYIYDNSRTSSWS
jgi:hypothetical protein